MTDNRRTQEWLEMALDVISAANFRSTVRDFQNIASIKPTRAGMSIKDRIRVGEELIELGMVKVDDGRLILARDAPTPWLYPSLADGSQLAWKIIETMNPGERGEQKFDPELLAEIGLKGELAVIENLKFELPSELHARIHHVSLSDDQAGYDIFSPSCIDTNQTRLLEVKTTCRSGKSFRFFISFWYFLKKSSSDVLTSYLSTSASAYFTDVDFCEMIGSLSFEIIFNFLFW
jgi:hypothetical protein